MRRATKHCHVNSADLLTSNANASNNNNQAMTTTPETEFPTSPVNTVDMTTIPEPTSGGARIADDKMTGGHVESAGKSLTPDSVTADVVDSVQTKRSASHAVASAAESSAGSVFDSCWISNVH